MSSIGWDDYNDCPLWQFSEDELEEHDKEIREETLQPIKDLLDSNVANIYLRQKLEEIIEDERNGK